MFRDRKTEEPTLDSVTVADIERYGGGMREEVRAYIEQSKRDEDYGLSMIRAVGVMALIFIASLWCFAFGVF